VWSEFPAASPSSIDSELLLALQVCPRSKLPALILRFAGCGMSTSLQSSICLSSIVLFPRCCNLGMQLPVLDALALGVFVLSQGAA